MKKIISNYAGKLLSREDLKAIKGGYDEGGCPQCTGTQLLCSKNFFGDCQCFADSARTCGN